MKMPAYHSWEYYVLDMDAENGEEKIDSWGDLEDHLIKLGKEGWETSLCFPEDDIIILKRPTDGITTFTGSDIRRKRPDRKLRESPADKDNLK